MTAPNLPVPALYAFPLHVTIRDDMGGTYYQTCPGMTLRDYFAAAAIPNALTGVASGQVYIQPGESSQDAVARVAYEVADAMLARRVAAPPVKP